METIIFKTCKCEKGEEKTIITSDRKGSDVKRILKCGKCESIIFPNKFNNCEWTYSDNSKSATFEISEVQKGRCYLYEEKDF